MKNYTSSRSTDESKVIKFRHVILDWSDGVSKFRAPVFIITCSYGNQGSVINTSQDDNTESCRQRLV